MVVGVGCTLAEYAFKWRDHNWVASCNEGPYCIRLVVVTINTFLTHKTAYPMAKNCWLKGKKKHIIINYFFILQCLTHENSIFGHFEMQVRNKIHVFMVAPHPQTDCLGLLGNQLYSVWNFRTSKITWKYLMCLLNSNASLFQCFSEVFSQ